MRILRYTLFFIFSILYIAKPESIGYQEWLKKRDALKQDKNVVRYYTFENVSGSESVVKDLSGNGGDLKYVPYIDRSTKEIFDDIKVVEGRWSEKNAVRLDRGFYQGPTYNIENRQFTAEVWFRRIAPGSIVPASKRKDGHIMSVSGYTQGWRIYTTYDPVSGVILSVGKKGGCNIRINAAITDNQWQHLVFTWDGKTINLYLNGMLISSTGYEEEYIAVGNPNQFKVGFSELGVGSIIVDIDEIILYNRVLTRKEVEELSKGPEGFSQKEIFEKADTFIKNRDYNKVRSEYEKLKRFPNNGLELALFNISESYRLEKDYKNTHSTFKKIFELKNLSPYYRIYGLFKQAEVYTEQKDYEKARQAYLDIIKSKNASKHHIFNARLFTADTYKSQGNYSFSKPLYEELLREEESSSFPNDGYRFDIRRRLEEIEGVPDGATIKNIRQKRAEWVNCPNYSLYVSLEGNDLNAGTKEKPFATIRRAQEEVKKIKEKGMPAGGINVYFRGGKYFLTDTIVFGKQDSGEQDAPVVYRNYQGEEVRIIGGKQVRNFKLVDEVKILERLPEEARGKVWVADLKEAGITEYGQLLPRGRHIRKPRPGALELICDGKIMKLARWPNEGWERVAGLTEVEGIYRKTEYQRGKFIYSGDRPERWKEEKDMWVKGYLGINQPYSLIHVKIGSIDTEKKVINLLPDILPDACSWLAVAPVAKKHPYFVYNILSELDSPGEFYLDRDTGKLYFYPPSDISKNEIIVTTLDKPIVSFNSTSNIVLSGLLFEGTWRNGIEIKKGTNNLIAGCTIRNTGQFAIRIESGWAHKVVGCDMYDMGEGGVALNGGDRTKLIPAQHTVENNHIHHYNRFCGGYRMAVWIEGIGQIVSHNLINDTPMQAIYFNENDHIIEYNEIHDVLSEGQELGAMYIYGESTALMNRGTIIKNNFFHHISNHSSPNFSHGINAIHIDAMNSGLVVDKNIFYKFPNGISSTFPGNYLTNNIFIEGEGTSISQGDRSNIFCVGQDIDAGPNINSMNRLSAQHKKFRTKQPPWSYRYPPIFELMKNQPSGWGKIKGSIIERNINTQGRFVTFGRDTRGTTLFENNWDGQDPIFLNVEEMDFQLRLGSPIYGLTGCDPVCMNNIGVYKDVLRASWPVSRTKEDIGRYFYTDFKAISGISESMQVLKRISPTLTFNVPLRASSINIDGELKKEEWGDLDKNNGISINKHFKSGEEKGPNSYVWLNYDTDYLYIGVQNEVDPWLENMPERLKKHIPILEVSIESQFGSHNRGWWLEDMPTGPIYIFKGDFEGNYGLVNMFNMPFNVAKDIEQSIEYKSHIIDKENLSWQAEMKIPLKKIGINPNEVDKLSFNIGISKRGGWSAWIPTGDSIWRIENAGFIKFLK